MALVGIPHGATDYYIYLHSSKDKERTPPSLRPFMTSYLLAIVGFGISWYVMPKVSLWIFLFFSAFHFGQTQLNYVSLPSPFFSYLLYITWGLTILTGIIYFNSAYVGEVLGSLKPAIVFLGSAYSYLIPLIFMIPTFILLVYAWAKGFLDLDLLILEFLTLASLMIVFIESSLLIGFTLFFGVWHSLISLRTELTELQRIENNFSLSEYMGKLLPFAIASLVGIGLLLYLNYSIITTPRFSSILLFFIAVSALTFPHVYFRNTFFNNSFK